MKSTDFHEFIWRGMKSIGKNGTSNHDRKRGAIMASKTMASGKDLNRSVIVRVGKKIRKKINPYLKRYSKIGDDAVMDRRHFPWLSLLEVQWEVIRNEAEALMPYREVIPPLSELSPDHARLDVEQKWRSFFLYGYGYRSKENCARCPKTSRILKNVPGLRTALFSIHEPGMVIAPHKGVTAGICVVHLGLKIPIARENCAIRVDDEVVHWKNGEAFVFDDTRRHETWNHTDEDRIILLLHVDRPLRFPGSLLSKLFMTGIRWSPFISDARRKMKAWDKKMADVQRSRTSSL